jgi:outer membrane autotransporter protein
LVLSPLRGMVGFSTSSMSFQANGDRSSRASVNARASSANIETAHVAAYAGASYGPWNDQVFAEVGYGFALGQIAAEPFAGLADAHLSTGSFTETGNTGLAALAGSGANDNIGYSTLGARLATDSTLPGGMVLTPRLSAAWQHAFGSITPTEALAFQSTGIGFTVAGVPLARDAALINAGADLHVTPQVTLGLTYVGELAGRVQDHSVSGIFNVKF